LKEHPEMMKTLENKIKASAGIVAEAMLAGPESPEEAAEATLDEEPAVASAKSKKSAS